MMSSKNDVRLNRFSLVATNFCQSVFNCVVNGLLSLLDLEEGGREVGRDREKERKK